MVGDGVNDASALAVADVGIAMGTDSATAADTRHHGHHGITVDRVATVRAGRRSLHIARQSVQAGMGLSLAAMIAAALGCLPPVASAVLQEGIDPAVILNALRARRA